MQEELQAIGEILREAREARGLTLAEVEVRTKISIPVLTALEEGDARRLPHPVYAKGFLRSYVAVLGLDAGDLCDRFARAYPVPDEMQDAPEERAAHIRVTVRHPEGEDRWRPWVMRLAGGLVTVVVAVGGWYGFQWYILPQVVALRQAATLVTQPANETALEKSVANETVQGPGSNTTLPVLQGTNSTLAPGKTAPMDGASHNTPREAPTASEKFSSPAERPMDATSDPHGAALEDAASASQQEPPPDQKLRTMRVEAVSDCWLQATVDDKVKDYFLRQGERVEVRFASSLRLKIGNAAGVRLWLDGQAFPVGDTRPGEVRTVSVP